MPERELESVLEEPDRRWARLTLALAYLSIVVLLIVVAGLSAAANSRADRASKSACTLVGVVDRQVRVIDGTVGLVLTPPGPARDKALADLRTTVQQDQKQAARVRRANHCS